MAGRAEEEESREKLFSFCEPQQPFLQIGNIHSVTFRILFSFKYIWIVAWHRLPEYRNNVNVLKGLFLKGLGENLFLLVHTY